MDIHALLEQLDRYIQDELSVRPTTRNLVRNLLLDLPLTPAQATDFGVRSDDHYRALRAVLDGAVEDGMSLGEIADCLDQALGSGPLLNELVRTYASQYREVYFSTRWDTLQPKQPEESC